MRTLAVILLPLMLCPAGVCGPATAPASRPAREWGGSKAGLQASVASVGAVRVGGELTLSLRLRNAGRTPVELPKAPAGLRAWVVLVYGRDRAFVSAPLELTVRCLPATLGRDEPLDLGQADAAAVGAYPYRMRKTLYEAYLKPGEPAGLPEPPGTLREQLAAGEARAKVMLFFAREEGGNLALASNTLALEVLPPKLSSLSAAERKTYVAGLLAKFDRDAFGGKAAHGIAVKIGREIVPDLIEAVEVAKRPTHSRMWLTAALADIPSPKSARALEALLEDRHAGVRHVAAYHGPKQRAKSLDAAIIAAGARPGDPALTARALTGFLVHRGRAPQKLLSASVESDDPRVRSAVAAALSKQGGQTNLLRLVKRLEDEDERIRAAAAASLGAIGNRDRRIIAALREARRKGGKLATRRIDEALKQLGAK